MNKEELRMELQAMKEDLIKEISARITGTALCLIKEMKSEIIKEVSEISKAEIRKVLDTTMDTEDIKVVELLGARVETLEENADKLGMDFEEIKTSQNFLSGKYDERTAVESQFINSMNLTKKHETLIKPISKEIEDHHAALDEMDQRFRLDYLEYHEIPETADENPKTIVLTLTKSLLKVEISEDDISSCYCLPKASSSPASGSEHQRPSPILVNFTKRSTRDEIYSKRTLLKPFRSATDYPIAEGDQAKKANLTMRIEVLRDELRKKNHSKVLSKDDFSSLSLSTGGLCGSVHLLYASLSEFLLVYHTPLRTTGNTGRHFLNMSVTVLQGNVQAWNERSAEVITRPEKSQFTHRIGERTFVEIQEDTCLLVYGRGLVPLTMGYWVWDSLFSSLDPASAAVTLVYYFRAVYSSLDISTVFSSLYDSTWALAANGVAAVPEMWESFLNWITKTAAGIFQSDESIMKDN